ncbi:hypothetical protein IGL98_001668 [Enterococcus sp. DIV0840]|nr:MULTISPECIES: hypothetical protein [Enterococcus]
MIKIDKMIFEIDGMVVPSEKVIEWEYKRLITAKYCTNYSRSY